MLTTLGIDVSSAQGRIDWTRVARESDPRRDFAICKLSEGAAFIDPTFGANWAGAHVAGLRRGAYEFAHLEVAPEVSAEHTCHVLLDAGLHDDDLPPTIDVERLQGSPQGQGVVDWVLRWLERVATLTGRRGMVYTGLGYWGAVGNPASVELARYPLWLACYVRDPEPYVPLPWHSVGWTMWQETGDQAPIGKAVLRLPGIAGNVDSDVLRGTIDALVEASHIARSPTDPAPAREPGLELGDGGPAHDPYTVDRLEAEPLPDTKRSP